MVAFISLILSFVSLILTLNKKSEVEDYTTKYTLYIGTNDKDTYTQIIPYNECVEKVTKICIKYTGGCTISSAKGYWNDETDTLTYEDTIVVILEDISKEIVYKICDEVIVELNQNSILIETGNIKTDFYSLTK